MAKCRIGHFVEAQILQSLEVDYIDESEVLTMADETHHINKNKFKAPFVCGCRDLGEALRRIAEGAAMMRTKVSLPFNGSDICTPLNSTLCKRRAKLAPATLWRRSGTRALSMARSARSRPWMTTSSSSPPRRCACP